MLSTGTQELNVVTGAFSYTGKYIAQRLLSMREMVATPTGGKGSHSLKAILCYSAAGYALQAETPAIDGAEVTKLEKVVSTPME